MMLQARLYILVVTLVLVGGLNWGIIGLTKVNPVNKLLGSKADRVVYVAVGLAALYLAMQRDTYLPFLSEAVIPTPQEDSVRPEILSEGSTRVTVDGLPPNSKVMYWASLPNDNVVPDPWKAYGDYKNQGVTTADKDGKAVLVAMSPAEYKVPRKGLLRRHIHYRYWTLDGVASRVETAYI